MPETTELVVPILKRDNARQILTGVVMEPDTEDAHGDIIPGAVEVEAAQQRFMMKSWQPLGLQHEKLAEGVKIIESFIAPVDYTLGEEVVKQGSWVMSVYCPDPIWKSVEAGEYTGFSIGALATRTSLGD